MNLTIEHVSKLYRGKVWGLKDFSLELGPGILGLVGPNGAGKSTLMRILATITRPTEGQVAWNKVDIAPEPNRLRQVLGYLPQDFGVYPNLNAVEFLEYMAAIKGLDARTARRRIDELLQVVNLVDARKRPLGGFSGGMKQRVGIAQALLNDPQLLIVDEPTAGLDPEERVRFRNLLSDLAGERIVILSTHIVSDVEAAATQIAIIRQGRLLRCETPEALLRGVEGKVWEWMASSADLPALRERHLISGTIRHSDGVQMRAVEDAQPVATAQIVPPRLEDAYLYFVQRQCREKVRNVSHQETILIAGSPGTGIHCHVACLRSEHDGHGANQHNSDARRGESGGGGTASCLHNQRTGAVLSHLALALAWAETHWRGHPRSVWRGDIHGAD
jgi:ABC-type multidrug transport system ATPase subunit